MYTQRVRILPFQYKVYDQFTKRSTTNDRDLTALRRRRRGWRLLKSVFLFHFRISHISGIIQRVCWYYNLPALLNMLRIRSILVGNISRSGSRSQDNAEFGHFTSLFYRRGQRNVTWVIRHVHSHCFAQYTVCLMTFSLPLPSYFE